MHLKWSKISPVINGWLIILVSMQSTRCSASSSSTLTTPTTSTKSDDLKSHLIKTSVQLLKNHLLDRRAIEPRATTSSQVIEYNARNIVLMTLLNSFLILGGLLGSLNRPELGGLPFKRKDPQHSVPLKKKRFWHRPRADQNHHPPSPLPGMNHFGQPDHLNHYYHHHHPNELAMQTLISNLLNSESFKDLQDSPPRLKTSRKPVITDDLLAGNIDTTATNNHHNFEYAQDIFPRMFAQPSSSVRRRNDDHVRGHVQSAQDLAPTNLNLGENCALLIHCMDSNGKPYYPSLSMLTKTALQLVNESLVETSETTTNTVKPDERRKPRKPRSLLLNTVKEMVELEQKNNSCQWKQLCQV